MIKRVLATLDVLALLPGQARIPFLPQERLDALRDARVRRIVAHAARTVPYYRALFARLRLDPREIRGAGDLDRLPLLARDEVRRDPAAFLSDSPRARDALAFLTSGTSGVPLEVRHDRRSLLANIAYGERERAAVIALCGGGFRPRELYVGYESSNFHKVTGFYDGATLLPRPRRSKLGITASFDEVVRALQELRPHVFTGYGGFLDAFFRTAVARGARLPPLNVVMYMGERLPRERREWIEAALGARVMSRYCAVESFKIGYFCEERSGFHLHDDLCHVRVLRDGRDARPGEAGEVVISNLVNQASVLLNYPLGDVAALTGQRCACGRTQRLLSEVDGRSEDVLSLAGGETLHPRAIWAVFKFDRDVLQYQLVQHELSRYELRLETLDEPAFARARSRAQLELPRLLGSAVSLEVTRCEQLGRGERGRTGKFRSVVSRLRGAAADGGAGSARGERELGEEGRGIRS